jgi:hypothetical protein
MKQDRFLIGIIVGILVLSAAALGVFFTRQASQGYVAEDTPEGVLHNYIYAIQQGDYERAYGYLANRPGKPSQAAFQSMISTARYPGDTGVRISDVRVIAGEDGPDESVIELVMVQTGDGPFGSSYSYNDTAQLIYEEGSWKIFYMPYPFWQWEWYNPDTRSIAPPN